MRLRIILTACLLAFPGFAAAQAQTYLGERDNEPRSVIRPASTAMWRNYVTVPDGPCGHPMAVQADCYNPTCRPCGPLHPVCFVKRVGRMLDCLVPCNLCCNGGCHGCGLGGRTWGHCSMCCGNGTCGAGGWGGAGPACGSCNNGCCTNPAGTVFDSVPCCTTGGHCYSCSDAAAPPLLRDPFQDDPLPSPPRPTSTPATEVRRVPTIRTKPVTTPSRPSTAQPAPVRSVRPQVTTTPSMPAKLAPTKPAPAKPSAAKQSQVATTPIPAPAPTKKPTATSPYKIVTTPSTMTAPATLPPVTTTRKPIPITPAVEEPQTIVATSVLKRASAEIAVVEPAQHTINHALTMPIADPPIPDYYDTSAPANPLR